VRFFFTDETNLPFDPAAKFLAYGGLIVPPDKLSDLHPGVENIRRSTRYPREDQLKFQISVRPPHVTDELINSFSRVVPGSLAGRFAVDTLDLRR